MAIVPAFSVSKLFLKTDRGFSEIMKCDSVKEMFKEIRIIGNVG